MTEDPLLISSSDRISPEELVSRILTEFKNQYGLDIAEDPVAVQRISEAVENALRVLHHQNEAEIFLPYISANQAGPIHLHRMISRTELGLGREEYKGATISEPDKEVPQRVQIPLPDNKPLVTISLLVIMALFFVFFPPPYSLEFPGQSAAWGMKINQAILEGEYWRLITPMFLHGSIFHLGFNLYALYILGRRIERFFGSVRFTLLFLIAGITGNLFSFIFTPADSLGSSTAIFGLLAAEGVFIYYHRELFGDRSRVALRQIIQVAVINFLIGLSPWIDNWGHFGGLIGGALFSWFAGPVFKLKGTPPRLRFDDQRPGRVFVPVFLVQLLLLICLTAWVIISRT
jgi:rhomboid protease GluP